MLLRQKKTFFVTNLFILLNRLVLTLLEKSALKQSFVNDINAIISKEFTFFFAKVTGKTHFFILLFF